VSRLLGLAIVIVLVACGPAPRPTPVPPGPVTPRVEAMSTAPAPKTAPAPRQTAQPQPLVFPDDAFRATQPAPGPVRPFKLPAVKPFTLANGVKVYLVEQHALPLVSMELGFDAGTMTDPRDKPGLAAVCTSLLTEGTAELDKLQYAGALAAVASTITASATQDRTAVRLSTLTKHLPATFAQLVATVRTPGFRVPDFERLVKRQVAAVRQSRGGALAVGWRVHFPVMFGPDHPFGAVTTEASLGALAIDDCKRYVAAYLQPAAAQLFVVGDVTEAEVRALAARTGFAAWRGKAKRVAAPPAPRPLAGRIFFVHVPGAAESSVALLALGPKRKAGDFDATTLAVGVFGGSFGSRLNMNLRETRAYTYGAFSEIRYGRYASLFDTVTSVRTEATYQAMLEIDREVVGIATGKKPVTAAELAGEQSGVILGLPGQFATAEDALGRYRQLVYFGLPLDYYRKLVARVRKVDVKRINAAAAAHLAPARGVYLIVGDGDAKVIRRATDGVDVPYEKAGVQLTLRQALAELADAGTLGKGALVELDVDGRPR
jgi:zinc protease